MVLNVLQGVLDAFSPAIVVPLILLIVALFLRVPVKEALLSALRAGVGLQGFTMLINAYSALISPVVQMMVEDSGINLPVFDMGWQAASLTAYGTYVGMLFLGPCILLQLLLFFTRFTDVFQASDLWNNYSYMIWGSMVYLKTQSLMLSVGCMVLLLLISLLCAEAVAPRFEHYYGYPGCVHASLHVGITVPYAIPVNWLLNKLRLDRVQANPATFQKRLGAMGDPMVIGAALGLVIGVAANITRLSSLAAWGSVSLCVVATAAVIAIFPRVAEIFSAAFGPLAQASQRSVSGGGRGKWWLNINDTACYGEPATLICGILLMPVLFVLAFLLPGNRMLPVLSLTAIPYMIVDIVPIGNGNMVKTLLSGLGYLVISLYVCSWIAPLFTEVAVAAGMELGAGVMLVAAFSLMGSPLPALVMAAFASAAPLPIALCVTIYLLLLVLFKRNRAAFYRFMERQAAVAETRG